MDIVLVLLIALVVLAFYVGMSALMALIVMYVWNYIVEAMHHPELHAPFLVVWGVMFLLSIIFRPFKVRVNNTNENVNTLTSHSRFTNRF